MKLEKLLDRAGRNGDLTLGGAPFETGSDRPDQRILRAVALADTFSFDRTAGEKAIEKLGQDCVGGREQVQADMSSAARYLLATGRQVSGPDEALEEIASWTEPTTDATPTSIDAIYDTVRAALADLGRDLLDAKWKKLVPKDAPAVSGHCYIGTEALWTLLGGRDAGFSTHVCSYYKDGDNEVILGQAPEGFMPRTHWWVQGPDGAEAGKGKIWDPTVNQYRQTFPYDAGKPSGFQQPHGSASKRAVKVLNYVNDKLGSEAIRALREKLVRQHQTAVARNQGLGAKATQKLIDAAIVQANLRAEPYRG